MKLTFIIAEYNPFHNGHLYQIRRAKAMTGSDYTIVLMSGDFVQRGGPACADKYTRTRMALAGGADLVLELPCLGAGSSAETFAACAVSLANRLMLPSVSQAWLCFGCENAGSPILEEAAALLAAEPDSFKRELKEKLKRGANYPAARSQALIHELTGRSTDIPDKGGHLYSPETIRDILAAPNNILAIEYYKALIRSSSRIRPLPMGRRGAGHSDMDSQGQYMSAGALRAALARGDTKSAETAMPSQAACILREKLNEGGIMQTDDFFDLISYALLCSRGRLNEYCDVSDDLADRLENAGGTFSSLDELTDHIRSKNITAARVRRCLFHIMLGHKKAFFESWKASAYAGPLSVLGFRKEAAGILSLAGKAKEKNHLILRSADREKLAGIERQISQNDLFASRLYRMVYGHKYKLGQKDILSEAVIKM